MKTGGVTLIKEAATLKGRLWSILLKNSENEEWQKSRSRTPNFTALTSRWQVVCETRARQTCPLRRTPDGSFMNPANDHLNCDRHKNSSFSTVSVEISYSAVALARKLLVALWRYVKDGVIPEGAKMKTA
jgi:hypothetical protein